MTSLDELAKRARRLGASGPAVAVFSQVATAAAVFILTPLQLMGMGSGKYGLVVVLASTIGWLSFLECGLSWSFAHLIPKFGLSALNGVIARCLALELCLSVTGSTLLILLRGLILSEMDPERQNYPDLSVAFVWFALSLPLATLSITLGGISRGLLMQRAAAVIPAVQIVSLNLIWVFAASHHNALTVIAAGNFGVNFAVVIVLVVLLSSKARHISISVPECTPTVGSTLRFGGLVMAAQIGLLSILTADKLIVGLILSPGEVAAYALAFGLAQRLTMVSGAISSYIFPLMSGRRSSDAYDELSRRSAAAVCGLTSPFVCLLFFAGPQFLELWLGETVAAQGTMSLRYLAIGFYLLSLAGILAVQLQAVGRASLVARSALISGTVALVSCGLLARAAGAPGAAAAVTLSLTLYLAQLAWAQHSRELLHGALCLAILPIAIGSTVLVATFQASLLVQVIAQSLGSSFILLWRIRQVLLGSVIKR